jgi:hypothetical protein
MNIKLTYSDLIENTLYENGFDLADYYFKEFNYI